MKSLSSLGAFSLCSRISHYFLRFVFLSVFLTFISVSAYALDYYWVGGSGLWSDHNNHWATTSGGNTFHNQVPTSMDNVYFDTNSFPAGGTVTIDPTIIYCMDMDWTGATGMPVFEGPSDKQVWVYGSLMLIEGMEWGVLGEVHFRAFQIGKMITSAEKEFLNDVYFDGAGGGWTLLDALYTRRSLWHMDGALFTNGQDMTVIYQFSSQGAPTRTLHFGSSNINIGGLGQNCISFNIGTDPFDFDAGTSTIHMTGPINTAFCGSPKFYGGNKTYYNLVCEVPTDMWFYDNSFHSATFLNNANISGNNQFDNLTFTAGKLYELASGYKQTINPGGTFNGIGSCSDFLTIVSTQAGNAAQIEKSTGAVMLSYVVLQDIHAIGGATFNVTNSVDLGNNAGWTFLPTASRNLYWVGGGGNWNDMAHWSLASGGTGGECIPTPFDNVFFDQNSGFALLNKQVNINVPVAFCQDMDWTGVPNSPELTGAYENKIFIFGSLKFVFDMAFTFYGETHFMAHATGKTITSAEKEFLNDVYFDGAGGGWTLLDALYTRRSLWHMDGALFTNGQDMTVIYQFSSQGAPTRALHFGSSNINIGGLGQNCISFNIGTDPFDFDAGTSTIHMTGPINTAFCGSPKFYGGNKTYYNLVCEVPTDMWFYDNSFHSATFLNNANISGNNQFDNLTFTAGKLYELASGYKQTINPGGTFNGIGSCSDFLTIVSTQAGNAAQIEKSTGAVMLSYVVLQDIHAIGGATFNVTNSVDLGNNAGWTFLPTASRNLYWVGGGGNWNDMAHWSLASGGTGGECIPTPFDNVFFDQNSGFALLNKQVNINVPVAFCQDMDWTGVPNSPELTGAYENKIFIFGSLKFVFDMAFTFYGETHFMAHATGKTITSAEKEFLNDVYFDGAGGGWTLLDALYTRRSLWHMDGALFTNGQDMTVIYQFSSQGAPTRALHFGSSNINIGGLGQNCISFNIGTDPFDFDAGTSTIHMTGPINTAFCGSPKFYGGNKTYYNLVCEVPTDMWFYDNSFHSATFLNNANISGNNQFEFLTFSPGSTYEIASYSTQTITPLGNFIAEGTGGFPIEIKSSNLGQQATLHKDGDPICLDFLYLTDMAATGTGFRYAGANSDNVYNNSGWIFEACPDCFNQTPAPAPTLDPVSVTQGLSGDQANLVIQNVPAGNEVVWFNGDQTQELYANVANQFQPTITGSAVFYSAFRDQNTGCISELLAVQVSILPEYAITYTTGYCTNDPGPMIGLSNSYQGYTYQLQTSGGANLGAPVDGTGLPIVFGAYPNGDYQVVVTGPAPTQTITGTVFATAGDCEISVPNFCLCDAADGRAEVTVKMTAPSGQIWTVKAVTGLYDLNSPPAPASPAPIAIGTQFFDIGGNMYTLDALRLTTKGYWIQVTNGSSDFDIRVGNASW